LIPCQRGLVSQSFCIVAASALRVTILLSFYQDKNS
jgi:hypothetical protein